MVSKRKTRKRRKSLKKIKLTGGGEEDNLEKTVFLLYIKNTTAQILNKLLSPYRMEGEKTTKYKDTHKQKIIELWAKAVELTEDEFRTSADNIINARNKIIHPSVEDLVKMAENSITIIKKYDLTVDCNLESKIINFYVKSMNEPEPKSKTNTRKKLYSLL